MKPLTISFIGCGRIAFSFEDDPLRKKPCSHFGAVLALPNLFTPLSICDTDPSHLKSLNQRYGIPACFSSHQDLFSAHIPDVVVIATPTHLHAPVALDAIKAGVKGIILEKPVSTSLQSADKLLRFVNKKNLPVLVFHERRYDPLFVWAQSIIRNEIYGPVRSIHTKVCSASFPNGPHPNPFATYGGGALVHDGTHMIDMLHYLFSPLKSVSARHHHQIRKAATETSMNGLLYTKNMNPIYFDIDGLGNYFHFELDIFFNTARIRIGNGIRELFVSKPAQQYSHFTSLQRSPFPDIPSGNSFINAYQNLHGAVTAAEPLLSSLKDGVAVLERIYGMYKSAAQNGQNVTFPLKDRSHPFGNVSFCAPRSPSPVL